MSWPAIRKALIHMLQPSAPTSQAVAIRAYQCISAAGENVQQMLLALRNNQSKLSALQLFSVPFKAIVGEVTQTLPVVAEHLGAYDCRNARLALAALNTGEFRQQVQAAMSCYGSHRVGLVIGTSTSGIYNSEQAYQHFVETGVMPADFHYTQRHVIDATATFLGKELGVDGPCYAISTACSSSAKTMGVAQRLLNTGVCDAVITGGIDTLCRLTLFGFRSLDLIAEQACQPMDTQRCGINIGEGAGLLLLAKPDSGNADCPRLLAVGESSDAHHMSAPHPDGVGAQMAMRKALQQAGLAAEQIDYINLHATATPQNDLSEAAAIQNVFGSATPCSGIKGLLGHTLGASGAVEIIATLLALEHGFLPGTCGLVSRDPACSINMLQQPCVQQARYAMSNAFGFGGNNASVILAQQ